MATKFRFIYNGVASDFDDYYVRLDLFNQEQIWSFGSNNLGQIGDNTVTNRSSPVQEITFGVNWKQFSIGTFSSGIKTDGTLWTWGPNTYGQLGDNTTTHRSSAVQTVALGSNWYSIANGYHHTLAVKNDGTLWTWGRNSYGQIGDNTITHRSSPIQTVALGQNWTYVAAGYQHSLASKNDGTLWSFGINNFGQLGNGLSIHRSSPTQTLGSATNWSIVSGGSNNSAAIKSDGTLWTCGLGSSGTLGDNTTTSKNSPIQVLYDPVTTWSSVSCGYNYYIFSIKKDGTLWCWGNNAFGQLGTNETVHRSSPVQTISYGTNWSQVAGGYSTVAIKTDGTLWTWGRNTNGQLGTDDILHRSSPVQTITYGTNWSQVSGGNFSIAAIKTDGTLWTWGRNDQGQLGTNDITHRSSPVQTVAYGTNWSSVGCGYYLTAAIKTDGTLWTWGRNTNGGLGDNSITHRSSPVQTISFGTNWSQVSAGGNHIAAIKTDSTLWTWGLNTSGQLGDNTITHRSSPVQTVAGGTNWSQVSCGYRITAAIKKDGTLWLWGINSAGGLGDNTTTSRSSPVQTATLGTNWSSVSCNSFYTAAMKTDGTLWAWGQNQLGQLGNNLTNQSNYPVNPFAYGTSTNWSKLELKVSHAASIKSNGTLWCWGLGTSGQLADNTSTSKSIPVQEITYSTNWSKASVGGTHTGAIKTDSTLWTWGAGTNGQLGDATIITKSSPVQTLVPSTTWTSTIAIGGSHAAGIKTDGTLWLWGLNTNGRLGDNSITHRSSPVQTVSFGTNWNKVALGGNHSAAIKTDGTLWTWGLNTNGQLGDNTITHRSSPVQTVAFGTTWNAVSCGQNHTLATKTDGTLWLWGNNASGQLGDNTITHRSSPIQTVAFGTTWNAISGSEGGTHSAATKSDGTLWTWGLGTSGQLGDGTTTSKSSPVQVASQTKNWSLAGSGGTFQGSIRTDGTLWMWGWNTWGQLGTNDITHRSSPIQTITFGSNWSKISLGQSMSTATKTDGTYWLWGNNAYGQLGDNTTIHRSSPVQTISGGTNWSLISAGRAHVGGIKTDGTLWLWGGNSYGQIGDNTKTHRSSPLQIVIPKGTWQSLNSGFDTGGAAGIKTDGTLWNWGVNSYGQLGDNTTTTKSSPIQTIAFGNNWQQIASSPYHKAAIKKDGTLWLWGYNSTGQLGNNSTTHRSSPVQTVAGGTNWKQVSCGTNNTAAIKTDGTLWIWGSGGDGQLGNNTITVVSSPIQTITYGTNWSYVSCGEKFTAAIKTDGTFWSWGDNTYGQLGDNTIIHRSSPIQTVAGGTNWASISCGYRFVGGIKTDGTLWLWGVNNLDQLGNGGSNRSSPTQTSAFGTNWASIACGGAFGTAATKTDGTLWCWGWNIFGNCGDNTTIQRNSPVETVMGGNEWIAAVAGNACTHALQSNGTIWAFGSNAGKFGNNLTVNTSSPVQIITSYISPDKISCGGFHTAAISGGSLFVWGRNSYGQLGNNTITHRSFPIQTITSGSDWSNVACGYDYTAALKNDGTLWLWGRGSEGQLGNNSIANISSPVQTITGGTNWNIIGCWNHTFAIKKDGTLWTWGRNVEGQLGDGTVSNKSSPIQTANQTTGWTTVAGNYKTIAVKNDGTLWTCGQGIYGDLGDNTVTNKSNFVNPSSYEVIGTDWNAVSCGAAYTIAKKNENSVWGFGLNTSGQLGDNTAVTKSIAVQEGSLSYNWTNIQAGYTHTVATKSNGSTWAFGANTNGGLGDNTTTTRSSPVQNVFGGTTWNNVNAGNLFSIGTKSDGTIWSWGLGTSGQLGDNTAASKNFPTIPFSFGVGTNWSDISCGGAHTLGLKTDGTLWCWGLGTSAQLGNNTTTSMSVPIQEITYATNWSKISAGDTHSGGVKTDGTAWCWGIGTSGQIGDGNITTRSSPTQVVIYAENWSSSGKNCNGYQNGAIKKDGTLWTWGLNNYGQLGDNTVTHRSSPVQTVAGGTNWSQVEFGSNQSAGIKTDGTLWTWGYNGYGQLGDNTTLISKSSPVQTVSAGTTWSLLAMGESHCMAIKTDGTLWTWGKNSNGQLGDTTLIHRSSPVQTLLHARDWSAFSFGIDNMAAVKTNGTLWTWGSNFNGTLGDNTTTPKSSPVQTIAGGTNWSSVANAGNRIAAIKKDGTLWAWGRNSSGGIGDNTTTDKSSPIQTIAFGTNWSKVSCGYFHTAAIKTDGTLWIWGENTVGQLGNNTTTNRSSPVQTITFGTNWSQVSCGESHTAAIKTDGTLWMWGWNYNGQLGNNTTTNRSSPVQAITFGTNWSSVACGSAHTAAIKTDGTLWLWGKNSYGILGDSTTTHRSSPVQTVAGGINWSSVACGWGFTVATKTDGTLWTWGYNSYLGDNSITPRSSPAQTAFLGTIWGSTISASYGAAAQKKDGTLWTWGYNGYGQLGDNTTVTKNYPVQPLSLQPGTWSKISAGASHSAGILNTGQLYLWGLNTSGQLGDNRINAAEASYPVQEITFSTTWNAIICGSLHTAATKTDGSLWTWGLNTSGQLGDNTTTTRSSPVQTVTGGANWSQVSCGQQHTAAIKTDGTLWNWGRNSNGQLGDNTTTDKSSPVQTVLFGNNWDKINCGIYHSTASKTDGTLWTFGLGIHGTLGNNNTIQLSFPIQPISYSYATNWSNIACGTNNTVATKSDGTLWAWGINTNGSLGNNITVINYSVPTQTIAYGTNWSQTNFSNFGNMVGAIRTDGTLWTFGTNTNGQLMVDLSKTNLSSPSQIYFNTRWNQFSAGKNHSVFIRFDNTLHSSGDNTYGQLGNNNLNVINQTIPLQEFSNSSNWYLCSAGDFHTLALKTDGTLWGWGYNGYGQLGDNSVLNRSSPVQVIGFANNWKQVACGSNHSVAIKTDGTVWTWGKGTQGQLGTSTVTHRSSPIQTIAYGSNWWKVAAGYNNTTALFNYNVTL